MTDFKDTLHRIRSKTIESDWKWLRESEDRFFDPRFNTSLRVYLGEIIPEADLQFDIQIPKDIQISRGASSVRRFRPDVRWEQRGLIVEFDGIDHYKEVRQILADRDRDEWMRDLDYEVIRIPYWMTMSRENIQWRFGIDVGHDMCELHYGTFGSPANDYGLSISPLSMCRLGYERFLSEARQLPYQTRVILQDDLDLCYSAYREVYGLENIETPVI